MNLSARVLAAILITAGLLTLNGPASGATTDNDGYRPCESGQQIDLLLMMDESGSLNGATGADPDGTERTRALKLIRDHLKLEPDIRVALLGFDTEAKLHMPNFAQASTQHPSDQTIQASLGEQGDTDYTVALDAALEAFDRISTGTNKEDRCRVLVFFTDGIYDPVDGTASASDEEAKALELRRGTCSTDDLSFKERFLDLDIQTYAVLLGDSFRTGIQSADDHKQLMATVSMQVLRAITGHGSSPLVADLAQDPLCEPWSDSPSDQTGEIITVANIDDFANKLLEVVKASTQLLKWPDCDSERDGRRIQSAQLPAGVYIDEILIFAYGGMIDGYNILDRDSNSVRLPDQPPPQSRLRFDNSHLKGLEAGWTLEFLVTSRSGETTTLSCWGGRVATPLQLDGRIVDQTDRSVDMLLDNRNYRLLVSLGSYSCPIDAGSFTLSAVSTPGSPMLTNQACGSGKHAVLFNYQPNQDIDMSESVKVLSGFLEPKYAANLFPSNQSQFPAKVSVDFKVLDASANAPLLDCDGPGTISNTSGAFPGHIVARDSCTVIAPLEGTATIDVGWSSSTSPNLEWSPSASAILRLQSGDEPYVFDLESQQLPVDGQQSVDGTVKVTVAWQPPDGSAPRTVSESVDVKIDRLDATHTGNDLFFSCTQSHVTVLDTDVEVPQQTIKGSAGCVLEPPRWGSVTVVATWMPPPETPGPIDWEFDQTQITSGTLSNSGKELTLEAGQEAVRLDFETTSELENRHWDLTGDIHLVATWDSLIGGGLHAGEATLPVTLDLNSHDNLACSGTQLTVTNAHLEVPRDVPVKGSAGCVLEPPRWGSVTVAATWMPPPETPGPIDWEFDQTQITSGTLSNSGKELTLEAGQEAVRLDFETTSELENRHWDLTGDIHLVATWNPGSWGNPTVTEITLSAPLDLKGRANSALALWLTILFTVIAVLITYGGLYAILVNANRLPPPDRFFSSTWETTLERSPNGRLQVAAGELFRPTTDDLSRTDGDRKRKRWLEVDGLRIKATHSPFWNLGGLLAGGWGQLNHAGPIAQAVPSGRHPDTTRVLFDRLVVVAIKPIQDPNHPMVAVYFLVPALGPSSGVAGIEALVNKVPIAINDLTDRYDRFINEMPGGNEQDHNQPSSGPPPPPRPNQPSSGPPPPPRPNQPSSGPPPPPRPNQPSSGPPPPPKPPTDRH
jgi:hypothetical protein